MCKTFLKTNKQKSVHSLGKKFSLLISKLYICNVMKYSDKFYTKNKKNILLNPYIMNNKVSGIF